MVTIDINGERTVSVPVRLIKTMLDDDSPYLRALLGALAGEDLSREAIEYCEKRGLITRTGEKLSFGNSALEPGDRQNFTPAEIDIFMKEDANVRKMFKSAEATLGKPLKYGELNMLLGFYDWLKLPIDVIGALLEYCAGREYYSSRYIETIALSWASKGVLTIEAAHEQINGFGVYYRLMRAFCIPSSRMPHAREMVYMDKWLKEYGFSEEMVALAAERAIMNTGKATFAYADKILKTWRDAEAFTAEAVEKLPAAPARPSQKRSGKNYIGREWDEQKIDKLLQLENAYLDKKFNEIDL